MDCGLQYFLVFDLIGFKGRLEFSLVGVFIGKLVLRFIFFFMGDFVCNCETLYKLARLPDFVVPTIPVNFIGGCGLCCLIEVKFRLTSFLIIL
jgi:hypothetical protein